MSRRVCPVLFIFFLLLSPGAAWAQAEVRDLEKTSPSPSPPQPFINRYEPSPVFEEALSKVDAHSKSKDKVWTLPMLVDEALRRNPSTSQAWETARSAAANVGVARSYLFPTITIGVTAGPTYQTTPLYPGMADYSSGSVAPNISIQWLLLDFGATAAGVEAARFKLLGSNFDFNTSLQTVVLNVMTAYYNREGARSAVTDAEVALTLADKTLDAAEQKERAGLGTITDVLQARQNAAQAVFNLENARGNFNTSEVNLATAVGFPGNTKLNVAPPAGTPSVALLRENVDRLIDRGLHLRPDLASKYSAWRQQLAAAKQAEANIWPTITANITAQRTIFATSAETTTGTRSIGYTGISGNDQASAVLTFSVDVFDGGLKESQARSAKRLADAARYDLAQSELGVIANVASSYVTFRSAVKKVEAAESLVDASQKSYDSTNVSYRAGLKNILDLLTAQSNLATANTTLTQSRTNLFIASANLSNAIGLLQPTPGGQAPTAVAGTRTHPGNSSR